MGGYKQAYLMKRLSDRFEKQFINWQIVSYLPVYKLSTHKQGTHPL